MIAVDSSAIIVIFDFEPEFDAFSNAVSKADRLYISAVSVHEAGIVLRMRHGEEAVARLWRFLREENPFEIVPFDAVQAAAALEAHRIYGKGIHAKARLNMGDCAAYALAKTMNLPLLFKGRDFAATDLKACL